MTETIDYTALDGSGVLRECADDGLKWAAAFRQHAEKLGHHGMDEGWLIGWFCNAIEVACNTRRWRAEARDAGLAHCDICGAPVEPAD